MATSYVGGLGGATDTDFDSVLTFTTSRAIAAGEHVTVSVFCSSAVSTITVGSLSLSQDFVGNNCRIWSARATGSISSGATVTVTLVEDNSFKAAIGELLAGVAESSYVRATATNANFGSTIDLGTTDTSPLTDDFALGFGRTAAAETVNGATNGFTLGDATINDPRTCYKVLTSGGATGGNAMTLTAGDDFTAAIVVYKSAPAGVVSVPKLRTVQSTLRW